MNDLAGKPPRRWLSPSAALNRFKPPPHSTVTGANPQQRQRARYGFRIGGIGFLIGQNMTSEVLEQTSIHPLPNTPSWLRGLINVRGNLVPVFDIKSFLGLDEVATPEKHRLLILDQGDDTVGVIIDGLPHTAAIQQPLTRLPPLPEPLQPHVSKAYAQDEMVWLEFDQRAFFQALGGLAATL